MATTESPLISFLERPGGRVAYDVAGPGPLVVLVPGMGDLRYPPKLYAGRRPADFEDYRARVVAGLRRSGHARAFSLTSRTGHAAVEAGLARVSAPTLLVMGERDPDFADPRAEAGWVSAALRTEELMVPDAGHYPQSQQPEVTTSALIASAARVCGDG